MSIIKTKFEQKVEFYDLDPMNVVWHGNYIKYMEAARCDFLEKIGYTYKDMKDDGYMYPIATMEQKYISPCTLGQKLEIEVSLEEYEPALIFKYEIVDKATNKKIFKGKSMQICVSIKDNCSVYNVPQRFLERIKEYNK